MVTDLSVVCGVDSLTFPWDYFIREVSPFFFHISDLQELGRGILTNQKYPLVF